MTKSSSEFEGVGLSENMTHGGSSGDWGESCESTMVQRGLVGTKKRDGLALRVVVIVGERR